MLRVIETERLVLKYIEKEDQARMIYLFDQKEIQKTYMIPEFKNDEEKIALFDRFYNYAHFKDYFEYGIYYQNILIGWINQVEIKDSTIELGYVIDPSYWGQGFATEALVACIEELFEKYNTVVCGFFDGNIASQRVMIKAGMHRIDQIDYINYRNHTYKCIYYAINKEEIINE